MKQQVSKAKHASRQLHHDNSICCRTGSLNWGVSSLCLTILQDANLSPDRLRMAYTEMVLIVRKLYQECRLVHGDLSEYNILFHEVSQLLFTSTSCSSEQRRHLSIVLLVWD